MVKPQLSQQFFYKLCSVQFELYTIRPQPNTNMYFPLESWWAIAHHQIAHALLSHGQHIFYSIKYVFELPYLYSSITIRNSNLNTCCWFVSNCLHILTKDRKTQIWLSNSKWNKQLLLSISIYLFNLRNS